MEKHAQVSAPAPEVTRNGLTLPSTICTHCIPAKVFPGNQSKLVHSWPRASDHNTSDRLFEKSHFPTTIVTRAERHVPWVRTHSHELTVFCWLLCTCHNKHIINHTVHWTHNGYLAWDTMGPSLHTQQNYTLNCVPVAFVDIDINLVCIHLINPLNLNSMTDISCY